jgi:hypothetical protein
VKGREFLRKLGRFAHRKGLSCAYEPSEGKGSHGRVYLGSRITTLKDPKKEIGKGLLRAMCSDLGIDPRDL